MSSSTGASIFGTSALLQNPPSSDCYLCMKCCFKISLTRSEKSSAWQQLELKAINVPWQLYGKPSLFHPQGTEILRGSWSPHHGIFQPRSRTLFRAWKVILLSWSTLLAFLFSSVRSWELEKHFITSSVLIALVMDAIVASNNTPLVACHCAPDLFSHIRLVPWECLAKSSVCMQSHTNHKIWNPARQEWP